MNIHLLWWSGIGPDTPINEIGWTYVAGLLLLGAIAGIIIELRRNL